MMIRTRRNVLMVVVITGLSIFNLVAKEQRAESDLLNLQVKAFHLDADNMGAALSRISAELNIPIGLEAAQGGVTTGPRIRVNVTRATLGEVMTKVIEQDPRYKMVLVDGVLNIYPKLHRDPLLKEVLETKVEKLSVAKGTGRFDMRLIITSLPEVKELIERSQVIPSNAARFNSDYDVLNPEQPLDMKNLTVKGILNQLLRNNMTKYWIVTRTGSEGEFLVINF